eukprot:m.510784 g.510784  ORF g.510784 m.510784 type:complete len:68 (+) comp97981_c0_seq1:149-352(+)
MSKTQEHNGRQAAKAQQNYCWEKRSVPRTREKVRQQGYFPQKKKKKKEEGRKEHARTRNMHNAVTLI